MRRIKQIGYAGTADNEETERERRHRKISANAAEEGVVLLKNDHMLPLEKGSKIALFGPGARRTITGGTGSGDVHERYSVSIEEGLKQAGFVITSETWLNRFEEKEEIQKKTYYRSIFTRANVLQQTKGMSFDESVIQAYTETPAYIPGAGDIPTLADLSDAECRQAVYVIARNAGEGRDRINEKGDYQLLDVEKESIRFLSESFEKVLVIINAGGVIDLSFLDEMRVDALLTIHQPGMEAGTAVAHILDGSVSPSGHLTDTWAMKYQDYPNSDSYGTGEGNDYKERYLEGIYVGYRYFDKTGCKVRYPFGYGLSYTSFSKQFVAIKKNQTAVQLLVNVKNTGDKFAGKEVVQIYAALPQEGMNKEVKRLVAFAKTNLLQPGESEDVQITFDIERLTSFDEKQAVYVVEKGKYLLGIGESCEEVQYVAQIVAEEPIQTALVDHQCAPQEKIEELSLRAVHEVSVPDNVPTVFFTASDVVTKDFRQTAAEWKETEEEKNILDQMTPEQMAVLTCGVSSEMGKMDIGMSSVTVMGAAGETTSDYSKEPWNLANIVLADGPAGLRLVQNYELDENGKPYEMGLIKQFMKEKEKHEGAINYYQYCTRIPSGTVLAQTFNLDLVEEMGQLVADEMEEFHVSLWLAPGMNIHRNPLCGRNFEYYSEDPVLSGLMAAAMTKGVQSRPGVGTTIKHFVCNELENSRQKSDSVVSERALREIYLRGFEIAVKQAQPKAVMTSYNLLNGVHTANSRDLCTHILRNEWGFQGLVMTDWNTTGKGGSHSDVCILAGNDLIMPGNETDIEEIIAHVHSKDEKEFQKRLRLCAAHVVRTILNSNRYE